MQKNKTSGITLIALIITIIVLLMLAGVTIAALTGSDSAPAKANEASQKNDIGTAKDDVQLAVTNAITDAYQTAYVETGVSAGSASTTVGTEVIKAVAQKYQTNNQIGKATIEVTGFGTVANVTGNATVSISTTDFIVEGTIYKDGGNLTWGEIEENKPGIKIKNIPLYVAKDGFVTLDVKRRDVSNEAQVTWTSLTTNYATVNSTTGKVTGVAEGNAIIKASVTDGGTTYTTQCTIPVREIVVPHVGDFVTYDAGTWTADSTDNKIKLSVKDGDGVSSTIDANTSTDLPSSDFEFGGFANGSSKNGNATPNDNSYNYVKDSLGNAVTGWRIFDIADNGTITLISAGCPEDYYHKSGTNYGYISEYILTGEDNSPSDVTLTGLGSTYKKRDWTADYGDLSRNITAIVLTKSKLEDWYKKYVDSGTTDLFYNATNHGSTTGTTIFQKIYKTTTNAINNGEYESLIDNYSYYWFASASSNVPSFLSYVQPSNMDVNHWRNAAFGLRVLVSLPSSINLTQKPLGTKVLVDPRDSKNTYTYNVWGIN